MAWGEAFSRHSIGQQKILRIALPLRGSMKKSASLARDPSFRHRAGMNEPSAVSHNGFPSEYTSFVAPYSIFSPPFPSSFF